MTTVLAWTTSDRIGGVALLGDTIAIEHPLPEGMRHAQHLLPQIERMLAEANLSRTDIDRFACDIGPGSYTGLRIACATLKFLSLSLERPAVALRTPDVLAAQAQAEAEARKRNRIATVQYGYHGDLTVTLYQKSDRDWVEVRAPAIGPAEEMADACRDALCIGSGTHLLSDVAPEAIIADDSRHDCSPLQIARLARTHAPLSEDERRSLTPFYLRPPAAIRKQG